MAFTQAGARAFMIAHQMQLQAAAGNNSVHAGHVREFIDYANNLAEHYYQQAIAYTDKRVKESTSKEVKEALADSKVELKVDEKSAQSAEKSVQKIFRNLFG